MQVAHDRTTSNWHFDVVCTGDIKQLNGRCHNSQEPPGDSLSHLPVSSQPTAPCTPNLSAVPVLLQFTMTLSGMSPLFRLGCCWVFWSLFIPPHLEMHLCPDQDRTTLQSSTGSWLHLTKISYTQIVAERPYMLFFLLLPTVAFIAT